MLYIAVLRHRLAVYATIMTPRILRYMEGIGLLIPWFDLYRHPPLLSEWLVLALMRNLVARVLWSSLLLFSIPKSCLHCSNLKHTSCSMDYVPVARLLRMWQVQNLTLAWRRAPTADRFSLVSLTFVCSNNRPNLRSLTSDLCFSDKQLRSLAQNHSVFAQLKLSYA